MKTVDESAQRHDVLGSDAGASAAGAADAASPASSRPLTPLLLAASFLTAVPVPLGGRASERQLAAALAFFPLVGAALGGVIAVLDWLLLLVLPVPVVSVLDLTALALLTGGLHLDALMDTCDGLFGGRTVERRLAIMRDSRVGSFGVIGGVLVILLQYAALSQIAPLARPATFVAVLALARWAMVLAILAFPPARPDGLGATFQARARPWHLILATVFAAAALVPLGPRAAIGLVVAGLVWLGGRFITRQVGGLTGDSYGALCEASTAAGLLLLAAAWPW